MLRECADALVGVPWLLVLTHVLAFLAGIGSFAVYRRFRGEYRP